MLQRSLRNLVRLLHSGRFVRRCGALIPMRPGRGASKPAPMIPPLRDDGETHVGIKRQHNEDDFLRRPEIGLWAVADGAGGHQSGALASHTIIEELARIPARPVETPEMAALARQAILAAHHALCAEALARGPGVMIVSTVVVLIIRARRFACLWAGDSRAYLLRGNRLVQLTHDHSLVQALVDQGQISEAQAERHPQGNIITRAVGAGDSALELEEISGDILPGDRFLLCSDGLSKTVPVAEIAAILGTLDPEPPTASLITASLAHGASDNVTAITIKIL